MSWRRQTLSDPDAGGPAAPSPQVATPADQKPRRLWTSGIMVVTAFYVLAYGLPLLGNLVFHGAVVPTVKVFPLTAMVLLVLGATYGLFLLLASRRIRFLPPLRVPSLVALVRRGHEVYRRKRIFLALAILVLAVAYLWSGLSDWRYAAQGISDTASPILLGLLLLGNLVRTLVLADMFYNMFVARDAPDFFSRTWTENVLLASALLIIADGTGSAFLALVALAYAVHPRGFRSMVFGATDRASAGRFRVAGVVAVLAVGAIFFLAWFAGESLKASSGDEGLADGFAIIQDYISSSGFVQEFSLYLVGRVSTYYYSLLFTVGHPWTQLNDPQWVLLYPLKNLLFRLDFLMGGLFDVARPDVGSLSVMNYRNLHLGTLNPREGSSPGLVSSFTYVFPFPLNIIICAVYMSWLARIFDGLLVGAGNARLSALGSMLVLAFVISLFQSPFDFLLLLDESVVYVAALLLMYKTVTTPPGTTGTNRTAPTLRPDKTSRPDEVVE